MMPRYQVTVEFTQQKDIGVWAKSAEEAMAKAEEIVGSWANVDSATALECEEE